MSNRPTFANHLKSLGRTVFRDNHIDGICPENPGQQLCFSVCRFPPTELTQAISHGFPSVHPVVASISLPPKRARPELFPTVSRPSTLSSFPSRSLPKELAPSYFPRFPFRPPCRRFHLAPSRFPFRPPCRRFRIAPSPTELSQSYFPRFPLRPPCRRFHLAPSHRALPKYFPRFPVRPPCRLFRIAPSQRSSPQAISDGYPPVHPLVASVSLPSRESQLNENPSIRDAFGKKDFVPNGSVMQPIFSGSLSCVCVSLRTQTLWRLWKIFLSGQFDTRLTLQALASTTCETGAFFGEASCVKLQCRKEN